MSVPGEVIGVVGMLPASVPYLYQIDSWGPEAQHSGVSAAVWYLWSLALLATGVYFSHRPDMPPMHHKHPHQSHPTDAPMSPRSIGIGGSVLAVLCFFCLFRDKIILLKRQSANPPTYRSLAKLIGLNSLIPIALMVGLHGGARVLHHYVTNIITYMFLTGVFGLILGVGGVAGSVLAAVSISDSTSLKRNPALHPIPMAIQLLGWLIMVLDCLMVYGNPDWWGVALLSVLFASDAIFIVTSLIKRKTTQSGYKSIPLQDL